MLTAEEAGQALPVSASPNVAAATDFARIGRAASRFALPAVLPVLLLVGACAEDGSPATTPIPPATPTDPPISTPPAPDFCGETTQLWGVLGPAGSSGIASAQITLRTPDAAAALNLVAPYVLEVPDGGANLDVPGLRPTVGVFASDFAFREVGACFEQSVRLEWAGELHLVATGAGRDLLTLRCDSERCSTS